MAQEIELKFDNVTVTVDRNELLAQVVQKVRADVILGHLIATAGVRSWQGSVVDDRHLVDYDLKTTERQLPDSYAHGGVF